MPNKLVDGRSDQDSVFLIKEDLEMTVGREDGKDGWNDAWMGRKLSGPNIVETQGPDGVWNGLDDLLRNK